jgi:DNA-binding MarR family transcriptional regulator
MESNVQQNGLITKWGNEVFDDGVMNAPMCITKYGYRFMTGGEYAFVMTLMSYKYTHNNPYPSQQTIADDMGVHVSQIERWVRSLFEKKGLIDVYERKLEDGTRTSNEYSFAPLLNKCLAESKKEKAKTEPKVSKTKRTRIKKEETAIKIPPTKCRDGEKPSEIYPIQNVGMDTIQNVGMDTIQNVGMDTIQNVGLKKEREERNLRKEKKNVCIPCPKEKRLLELIHNREDLKTHTKKIIQILNAKKKNKTFKYDVFEKTLAIIDVDIKGINYLTTALMNNLRKGSVEDFNVPNQQDSEKFPFGHKQVMPVPNWYDKRNDQSTEQEVNDEFLIERVRVLRKIKSEEEIKNILLKDNYSEVEIKHLMNLEQKSVIV